MIQEIINFTNELSISNPEVFLLNKRRAILARLKLRMLPTIVIKYISIPLLVRL